jgi:hypothetical protein
MRLRPRLLLSLLTLAVPGCAAALPPASADNKLAAASVPLPHGTEANPPGNPVQANPPGNPVQANPAPVPLTQAEARAEAAKLRAALEAEVPQSRGARGADDAQWIARARSALSKAAQQIDRPQVIVAVDRSPRVQALRLILAMPGDAAWEVIGGTHVSTGQTGRFDHYITPLGVFPHTDAILDFRAEGTFNENHIRGLGLKGMRVWDFGWQVASKGWLDNQAGPMRLLMHATDPANLEHRIGARASSGCVRVPATLNVFMDRHGVLDYDYERAAVDDGRYRWLLRKDRVPTPLSGDLMIVFDSAEQA